MQTAIIAGMERLIAELPKAELHVHLEGSLEPETLCELDPALTVEEVRERYRRVRSFPAFIEVFRWILERLRGPADYALALRRLLERLETQRVAYAEITLSAGTILWQGKSFAPVFEAVAREAARSGIEVRWILDAVRHFGPEHVRKVAALAVERAGEGVVGFGIGGDEIRGPARWFHDTFRFVRDRGLRLTIHAGETAGPESVRQALEAGAERIGHGVTAAEDPALLEELARRRVALEVCLSSNAAIGVVPRIEAHPLPRFLAAGVPVTLATDDPAIFATTLNREYEKAAEAFDLSAAQLRQIAAAGFVHRFHAGAP